MKRYRFDPQWAITARLCGSTIVNQEQALHFLDGHTRYPSSCYTAVFLNQAVRANVPWHAAWRNHHRVAARAFHERSVDGDKRCLLWSRLLADSKLDTVSGSLADLRISRPSNPKRWQVAGLSTCTNELPTSRFRCHRTAHTT